MDSDRWKQVDNLLQSVLERPPAEREQFCGRHARAAGLEREVRSCSPRSRRQEVSWKARL
jgi:hypothetical protein